MSCQAEANNPNASNLASRLLNFVVISASVLFQRAQKAKRAYGPAAKRVSRRSKSDRREIKRNYAITTIATSHQRNNIAAKLGIPDNLINDLLSKLADKYVIGEQQATENDRLLQLLELGGERELKNAFAWHQKERAKRILQPEEAEEVIGERVDKLIGAGGDSHKIA
jgi:hypothetical protein